MKIGVFTVLFGNKPFEETLDYVKELGLEAVEIGTGAYPGDAHCKPAELLKSEKKLKAFKDAIASRGLVISALSCHGNPIHPDKKVAKAHDAVFRADGRARVEARREAGDHVLRLPGRRPEGDAAQLDHLVVAARVPRDARVAVEGARAPLLEGDGEVRQAERRACRHRDAPQLRRLQPGDDAAAGGCGQGHHRLQLRSEPHVLAAGGRADRHPHAGRPHLPRARQGLQDRRRPTRR